MLVIIQEATQGKVELLLHDVDLYLQFWHEHKLPDQLMVRKNRVIGQVVQEHIQPASRDSQHCLGWTAG